VPRWQCPPQLGSFSVTRDIRINFVLPLPDTDSRPTGSLEVQKPLRRPGTVNYSSGRLSMPRPPIRPLVRRYSHTFALVAACTAFLAAKFIAHFLSTDHTSHGSKSARHSKGHNGWVWVTGLRLRGD
jgi:hypothetical protein